MHAFDSIHHHFKTCSFEATPAEHCARIRSKVFSFSIYFDIDGLIRVRIMLMQGQGSLHWEWNKIE